MKAEQVKKLMPVLIAYAEGKTIEFRSNGQWRVSKNLEFCYEPEDYRVKPEPQTFWCLRFLDGVLGATRFSDRDSIENFITNNGLGRRAVPVKFIEVLE